MSGVDGRSVTRRRVLAILAGVAGVGLGGGSARAAGGRPQRFTWRGTALGADAAIVLFHPRAEVAETTFAACLAEIERLEREFSLYRPDSALVRLNETGNLPAPSLDMRALLAASRRISERTEGAFDPTVQVLWRLYARHFTLFPGDRQGPPPADIARARHLVDYRRVVVAADRIVLPPGMALTLNGIAQGYVTDRVADLLRVRGWSNVLINLGEFRALDGRPDGVPWSLDLANGEERRAIPLVNRAIAVSRAAATAFEPTARHHHLFVPSTGESATQTGALAVLADSATVADGLSTALYVMPAERRPGCLRRFPGVETVLLAAEDARTRSR